jgi:hypothetical protein
MVEAFPEDTAPRYLLRDRDKIYGCEFHQLAFSACVMHSGQDPGTGVA